MTASKTLHLIGNAHIDPVWLWTWQEGYHEVHATFRSALDRMNEFPDFTFTASSACLYAWIEEVDPYMFSEIQARITEGRWRIAGGWWIEPDANIPWGESLVRQGLYGQRYFQSKFGKISTVAYLIDTFGHNAALPQIFRKSGMDSFVFMRPMAHEMKLPGQVFWWQGLDGTRVLAGRIPFTYCTQPGDQTEHVLRCADEIKSPLRDGLCFYGVGNHGGGPTKKAIESLQALMDQEDELNLEFSSLEAFFHSVQRQSEELPVVAGELQHHASGCYAAHSGIKRWNRLAENRLLAAEKWSSLAAWLLDVPYPDEIESAWKAVLFNQFHDILAGTSIETAYEDACDSYGEALAISGRSLNRALQSFSWEIKIDLQENAYPFVAFNPLAFSVKVPVEMEFNRFDSDAVVLDDTGRQIPFQAIDSPTTPWRQHLTFVADLPSLGYRTYRLIEPGNGRVFGEGTVEDQPSAGSQETIRLPRPVGEHAFFVGNGRLRLQFNPESGAIRSLYDLKTGIEILAGDAPRTVVIDDPSDTWSHGIYEFHNKVGEFELDKLQLVEQGPVLSLVRATSHYRSSTLVLDYRMYDDLDWIGIGIRINWQEHNKLLKLKFPVNLVEPVLTYEIPYGAVERPANGQEEPLQRWLDLSGKAPGSNKYYGFSLINDGKYSADVLGSKIGLTALRSPAYAHHDPAKLLPDGQYVYIDQGIQQFELILYPHPGGWRETNLVQLAAVLNQPPVALQATFHPDGEMGQAGSFLEVTPGHVVVEVIKKAEDSDYLVLRAYESAGIGAQAMIRLQFCDRVILAKFGPYEIKTFLVPRLSDEPVVETDLLESTEAGS